MDVVETGLFILDPGGHEGERGRLGAARLWHKNDGLKRAREEEVNRGNR